jgi:type IV pilus assembly protein PilW
VASRHIGKNKDKTMFKRKEQIATKGSSGFTLVELMIAIAISSVVLMATYSVFNAQNKTYSQQQDVVDIQQNLRAGMYYLSREIRLAGYEQEGVASYAGILKAGPGCFHFTMDIYDKTDNDLDGIIDNDSDEIGFNDGLLTRPGEEIVYMLMNDADEDGFPDTLTPEGTPEPDDLGRTDVLAVESPGDTPVPDILVENVEAVAFAYAYDDDNDGFLDRNNGNTIWAIDTDNDAWLDTILDTDFDGDIDGSDTPGGDALLPGERVHIDRIRMVHVWMLVRSRNENNSILDQTSYVIGDKRHTVNDHYRRRLLTAAVVCRNLGG